MAVTRFEDLQIWQKARRLNKAAYTLSRSSKMIRDYGFTDQFRRSSISVMNNIAEGFDRWRRAEFLQYLSVAKGSAGELRSMMYAALDIGYITQAEFDEIMAEAVDVNGSIGRFRTALERTPPKASPTPRTLRKT